jgi:hypothetical protein
MMAKEVNLYRLHQQAEPSALPPEKAPPVAVPQERAVRARFGAFEAEKVTTNSFEPLPPSREFLASAEKLIPGVNGTYSLDMRAVASLIGQAGVKSATGMDGDRLIRSSP